MINDTNEVNTTQPSSANEEPGSPGFCEIFCNNIKHNKNDMNSDCYTGSFCLMSACGAFIEWQKEEERASNNFWLDPSDPAYNSRCFICLPCYRLTQVFVCGPFDLIKWFGWDLPKAFITACRISAVHSKVPQIIPTDNV